MSLLASFRIKFHKNVQTSGSYRYHINNLHMLKNSKEFSPVFIFFVLYFVTIIIFDKLFKILFTYLIIIYIEDFETIFKQVV